VIGGKAFDVPVLVTPSALHNFAETPVVLLNGTLVASYVDDTWAAPNLPRRHAWVVRSSDGGVTFEAPRLVNEVCGPPPNFQLSSLAVDHSPGPFRDHLYFACRQNAGGSVVVSSSADGGLTWAAPVPVGPLAVDASARRMVTLAVSPKGVLGVLIAERHGQDGDACLETTFSASLDGGRTFLAPQRVAATPCGSSPNDQMAQRRFPTYGDYYGLVATPDGRFRVLWPEMHDGTSRLLTTTIAVEPWPRRPGTPRRARPKTCIHVGSTKQYSSELRTVRCRVRWSSPRSSTAFRPCGVSIDFDTPASSVTSASGAPNFRYVPSG